MAPVVQIKSQAFTSFPVLISKCMSSFFVCFKVYTAKILHQ